MRWVNHIEIFLHDVRYGLRQLRRSPGFTIVAAEAKVNVSHRGAAFRKLLDYLRDAE